MKIKITENKLKQIVAESVKRILSERYDDNGFNDKSRIHKDTRTRFNPEGYDWEGYDENGFNKDGWSRDGINKETNSIYDINGFDVKGINKKGRNKDGFDKEGFNKDGFDINGYSRRESIGYKNLKKYFKDSSSYKKFLTMINKTPINENELFRQIIEYLYKHSSEIKNIPFYQGYGKYVDEEIGCIIDPSTIGSIFTSIYKYLSESYKENEARYLWHEYCMPLFDKVTKTLEIFSCFNMKSNSTKKLFYNFIDNTKDITCETVWFKMLEKINGYHHINPEENFNLLESAVYDYLKKNWPDENRAGHWVGWHEWQFEDALYSLDFKNDGSWYDCAAYTNGYVRVALVWDNHGDFWSLYDITNK